MVAPNLTGFWAALKQKRAAFAEPVTFTRPAAHVWPPDTPIDPETGLPYDPVLAAQATETEEIEVPANVAIRGQEDADVNAAGWFDNTHALAIVDLDRRGDVENATHFVARDVRYQIVVSRADGVAGDDRYLTYGRRT